ncbi:MAG: hypothetical protein RIR21_2090 [Pseudomonadota bacterium]
MRVFTTTPMFLLLALAMSSAYGQNAPAAAAATPAASKPADAKTDPKADTSKVDAKSAAAKPAAAPAASTDAKKPADASAKPATPAVADTKPDAKKPAAPASPAAATAAGTADDGAAAKPVKADGPPCVVAEFRAIGIDEQDVTKRRSRALSWLQQRSKQCSVEQLLMIRNNRSQWMGTADSAKLASVVDSLLEAIAAENPRVAALLYGTPPPPPPPGGEDKK